MEMIRQMMPQISLLVLVVVVAIGFIKKVNIGFFAIGATFLLTELAIITGYEIESNGAMRLLKASDIAKGFSSSMFVTLVGVTFLFGMASAPDVLALRFHLCHRTRPHRGRNPDDHFRGLSCL